MDRIGRYQLESKLGSGSFATVYKGHDEELDVPVAVKVLADNWVHNDDVRGRFLSEARLMRRINDERVCRVYDIGTLEDGRPYFVMDFANGGSLEELRKRLIEPGRALRLCAEAARALEVLHRHAVIHRDVTPGNILLNITDDGQTHVVLADLGVAKSMIGASGATMTAGTPAYMALEQATGMGTLDQRADVYSIAAVTYSLLTGKPPFPVKTLADLLSRNQNIDAAPIADRVGAPRQLDALLQSALSPNPERRPQTAEEFAKALDAIADGMPGSESYAPRPLASASQTVLRTGMGATGMGSTAPAYAPAEPVAPPMQGSYNWASYGGSTPYTPAAPPPQATGFAPVMSHETPRSMLTTYLGATPVEPPHSSRRGAAFWAWIGVAAVSVFTVALVLTILIAG